MCFALFVAFVLPVSAQTKPAQPRAAAGPRFDVSIGAGILGGSSLAGGDADLRARGSQSFELFATSTRLGRSVPIEARLTFPLGPRYGFEVRGAWARPELRTEVTDDVEGASLLTAAERVSLYSLEAGVVIALRPAREGVLAPFISGGAGYAGAVHDALTLLEHGVVYRGGGGFKFPMAVRTEGRVKGYGLRGDAGLALMTGGVTTGAGATHQLSASAALYLTF